MGTLDRKAVLVTGGGTGIGAEICVRLAKEGASVAVNGLTRDEVYGVVSRIRAHDGRAVAAVGDVADPDDVRRIVADVIDRFGGLHVVVNNAATQQQTRFVDLDLATWRKQLAVDLDGVFLVSSAAAKHMASRGTGVIINITSVHEHQPRPGFAAYCVAKAGVGMLTKVLARELAPDGIRVVSIAPGAIDTRMQGDLSDSELEEHLAGIPAGRFGKPEEVANLVAFVASPAAAYISGASLVIDGALETAVSLS